MFEIALYLKVFGIAENVETGELRYAGLKITIAMSENEIPYERVVKAFSDESLKHLACALEVNCDAITVITKEEYERDYGEEDDNATD